MAIVYWLYTYITDSNNTFRKCYYYYVFYYLVCIQSVSVYVRNKIIDIILISEIIMKVEQDFHE